MGVLYRAAAAGGELVYSYGGGVGIRSGDPADVNRLLIAAAHHQAAQDRRTGKLSEAAALMALVAGRFPEQLELQLAQVDSVLVDRKAPQAALVRLDSLRVPTEDTGSRDPEVGVPDKPADSASPSGAGTAPALDGTRRPVPGRPASAHMRSRLPLSHRGKSRGVPCRTCQNADADRHHDVHGGRQPLALLHQHQGLNAE